MCQAIRASLRATATVAMLPPRRAAIRCWKARKGRGVRLACQAASTKTCPVSPGPCFADPSVPGRLGAGLADARVEAEVADQLPGAREAADLADRGRAARAAVTKLRPGRVSK